MKRDKLTAFLDQFLNSGQFKDLGPNGLQVEKRKEIRNVITGVSASVELFKKAISRQADAVLVHHGIIWNFENPVIAGSWQTCLS